MLNIHHAVDNVQYNCDIILTNVKALQVISLMRLFNVTVSANRRSMIEVFNLF